MPFLPSTYEKPVRNSKYFKAQEGDNKIRVLSSAITGWLDWENKKPIRTKEKPETSVDPKNPAKHFWAFVIWNYQENKLEIAEVTQAGIQDAIFSLHNSEWGAPTDYDLIINRIGKDLDTKYTVMPTPKTETSPDILTAYQQAKINLEALYTGDDPFGEQTSHSDQDIARQNEAPQPVMEGSKTETPMPTPIF